MAKAGLPHSGGWWRAAHHRSVRSDGRSQRVQAAAWAPPPARSAGRRLCPASRRPRTAAIELRGCTDKLFRPPEQPADADIDRRSRRRSRRCWAQAAPAPPPKGGLPLPSQLRATDLDRDTILTFTEIYGAGKAGSQAAGCSGGDLGPRPFSLHFFTAAGAAAAVQLACPNLSTPRTLFRCLSAGTLYTLCRNTSDPKWQAQNIMHACDLGTQCCGYLGSPGRAGKLPDTCVRASEEVSECPRTAIGEQGAPCGLGGTCNSERNLTCCENIPFLGGLTSVKVRCCGCELPAAGRSGGGGGTASCCRSPPLRCCARLQLCGPSFRLLPRANPCCSCCLPWYTCCYDAGAPGHAASL